MNSTIVHWAFILITVLNISTLVLFYRYKKDILKYVKQSIEPKFLEIAISPETNKIINLWVDIWRLESRINEVINISNIEKEKLGNSIRRVKKYISDYEFEIKGFNWDKYSEEINIYELKATEDTDKSELDWIIKDTIEPAVRNKWNIIKQAKIIVYKFTS